MLISPITCPGDSGPVSFRWKRCPHWIYNLTQIRICIWKSKLKCPGGQPRSSAGGSRREGAGVVLETTHVRAFFVLS